MLNKASKEKYEDVLRHPRISIANKKNIGLVYNQYEQVVAMSIFEVDFYVSEAFYHDYVLDSIGGVTRR